MRHEICTCGHCRCIHGGGYEECLRCAVCIRYTWPGPGNELPESHKLTQVYKPSRPARAL